MERVHRDAPGRMSEDGSDAAATVDAVAGAGRPRVEDVHDRIVAWANVVRRLCDDKPAPTLDWHGADGPVRGIQVCRCVSEASISAARVSGATLIVAGTTVFAGCAGASVPGLIPVVRWAAAFSRHGLSCIAAPVLFDGASPDEAPVAAVAARLERAFPEVPVVAFPDE